MKQFVAAANSNGCCKPLLKAACRSFLQYTTIFPRAQLFFSNLCEKPCVKWTDTQENLDTLESKTMWEPRVLCILAILLSFQSLAVTQNSTLYSSLSSECISFIS